MVSRIAKPIKPAKKIPKSQIPPPFFRSFFLPVLPMVSRIVQVPNREIIPESEPEPEPESTIVSQIPPPFFRSFFLPILPIVSSVMPLPPPPPIIPGSRSPPTRTGSRSPSPTITPPIIRPRTGTPPPSGVDDFLVEEEKVFRSMVVT